MYINNNLSALNVAGSLNKSYGNLASSTSRLSSGLRINSAADDAAGLAIRELMRADIASLHQGARNVNDAISLIQTADGALGVIDEKLIRMKELAEQAATGTYNSTQRLMIDSEFQAMGKEIDRIANATDFNGIHLLDGSLTGAHNGSNLNATGAMKIHFGSANDSAEDYYYIDIPPMNLAGLKLGEYVETQVPIEGGGEIIGQPGGAGAIQVNYANANAAANALMGAGVNISKAEYKGHQNALGAFTNGAAPGLSIENGAILSTGNVTDAQTAGANDADTELYPNDVPSGNPWLDALLPPNPPPLAPAATQDAATLSITFTADASVIYFDFVFASEEYPDYLGEDFNDICAIFKEDNAGNVVNFAFLDNVVSINGQTPPAGLTGPITFDNIFTNPALFKNNLGNQDKFAANAFSHTLRIGVNVTPNVEQTLHFSIADVNDGRFDSWLLVGNFSTEAAAPPPAMTTVQTFKPIDIQTQDKAQQALERIDDAIVIKDKARANLGALQNRLENTVANITIQAENLQAAESRISDADVAIEMTQFVRNQILVQSGVAMLAQANSLPQMALQLITS